MSHRRNTVFTSVPYGGRMATFLLRVALPDRPGALGAVASRIGAVRADVVTVDIVGRGGGQAVDEFVVQLDDERHVSLLLNEIAEVDGVSVEEVRVLPSDPVDRRVAAYDSAIALMSSRSHAAVLETVVHRVALELDAVWVAALELDTGRLVAAVGDTPATTWLGAYVTGTRWYRQAASARHLDGEPCSDLDDQAEARDATITRTAVPRHAPSALEDPAVSPSGSDAGALTQRSAAVTAGAHLPCSSEAYAPAPDVVWTALDGGELAVIAGRPGRAFGHADRLHLVGVGRLADARWADLAERSSRRDHPSRQAKAQLTSTA